MADVKRPPAWQCYTKDWLTSKRIRFMSLEQAAGYHFLLCEQWDTEDCTLPDDDVQLAELSRLREKWPASRDIILRCFTGRKSPKKIYNVKLRNQWLELKGYLKKCSDGGKNSGKVRRNKGKSAEGPSRELQCSFVRSFEGQREEPMNSSSSSSSSSSIRKKEFNKKKRSEEGDYGEMQDYGSGVLPDMQAAQFLDRLKTGLGNGFRKDGFETIGQAFGGGEA